MLYLTSKLVFDNFNIFNISFSVSFPISYFKFVFFELLGIVLL